MKEQAAHRAAIAADSIGARRRGFHSFDRLTHSHIHTHDDPRSFGVELHGGQLGLGIGARELIDYTAEFRTWSGESKQ